jgi:uncharacterized protein (DUF433 family)
MLFESIAWNHPADSGRESTWKYAPGRGYAGLMNLLKLISSDPAICHGQACVKGTRIPVSVVLGALADGMTEAEILVEYPTLTVEGIRAAAGYGAMLAAEELLPVPTRE